MRQKNRALCWNNSAKFLQLFVLYKNFAQTMGFPHKTPAQVLHFLTRPGYKLAKNMPSSPGEGGGTPFDGLYGEAPPEIGTFFRHQVYKRVGISRAEVYETVGKFRYLKRPLIKIFRLDNNIAFWLTYLLFSPYMVH